MGHYSLCRGPEWNILNQGSLGPRRARGSKQRMAQGPVARANGRRGSQRAQKVPTRGKERPEGPESPHKGQREARGPRKEARGAGRGARATSKARGKP